MEVGGSSMEYRLLGRFEVRADGRPVDLGTPKQRAVLAVLLLEAGRVVSTDRLLELLWGDVMASTATLQSYVSNLRRALEPERRPRDPATVLVTAPPGYRVDVEPDALDIARFERLVTSGGDLLRSGDAIGARAVLDDALALWVGPLLPELADEPFVIAAASRLDGLRSTALGLAAEARLEVGDHLGAIGLLEGPVAEHQLDERLHGLFALGLYRAGRQADALRIVDRVRRALADTVGLDPGPDLRALEADLLAQSPRLDWSASPTPAAKATPLTPLVDDTAQPASVSEPSWRGVPMVGRDAELTQLTDALARAVGGRGSVAVVMGEPGIGKTRLVEELAEVARSTGVLSVWARCPESGAIPPFWPAVQLANQVRDAGALAATLTPPEDVANEQPTTLFTLYEAVANGLRSTTRPLLVVLDDLQWADADTLRLLAHVAAGIHEAPVLVLVTVRSVDDDQPPALLACLAAFARAGGTMQLQLGGLTLAAVEQWLTGRSEEPVPAEVAAIVHERTGGNALFVKELSELLASEGQLGDVASVRHARSIPPGVQFVVRRRISRLPAATQQLLTVASVVGRSFELGVVADVAGRGLVDALDALAPALDAGLVLDEGASGFRFSHALVAEALVAELNAARRAHLHAATAEALARRAGPDLGGRAALVAHHAMEGLLAGSGALAVEASVVAARRAVARFGYEEAAGHWQRAAAALEVADPDDVSRRLEVLCEFVQAAFQADLLPVARAAAIDAIDLAEAHGDAERMVLAASLLGYPHLWPNQAYGQVDRRAIDALERTRARVDPDDQVTLALVLGALAAEMYYAEPAEYEAVSAAAEAAARAGGDPAVLARILVNCAGPLRPSQMDRRLARTAEVLALAAEHDVPGDVELVGRFHDTINHWDLADFDGALERLAGCERLANRIGGGTVRAQLLWYAGATAVIRGRYAEAERLGRRAAELYRRTRRYDADLVEMALESAIIADRGGLDDFLVKLDPAQASSPAYLRFSTILVAWLLCECSRFDEAGGLLDLVDLRSPFPDDYTTLPTLSMAVHACCDLDRRADLAALLPTLEPFTGRWAQSGSGGANGGLVDLALARAAAALGDSERARELFDRSVLRLEELRAPGWLARGLLHQGRFSGGVEGRAALERAAALAERHGLVTIATRIAAAMAS